MNKKLVLLISIGLVGVLLSQIGVEDMKRVFAGVELKYIGVGFGTMSVWYVLKALRFYVLLGGKIDFYTLVKITCAHNFANTVLPARTGEVSYIYLIKKYNVNTGTGIATLIVARSLDFIVICLFFIGGALMIGELPHPFAGVIRIVAAGMLLVVMFLIGLFYLKERLVGTVKKVLPTRVNIIRYLLRKAEETVESMEKLYSIKIVANSVAVSIILWVFPMASLYFFLRAFGIELGAAEVVVLSCLLSLLPLLPFYGFGGFGTTEATSTALLVLFGVEKGYAIVASFGAHIVALLFVLVVGIISLARLA